MNSLCSQLRASFGAHAPNLILPCFGTLNLQTDGVPDAQNIHERFHSIQMLEGYYGVMSESSHSRMESLCTQLRASFGAHALDLILSCFGTPNLQTDGVSDAQAIHERFYSIRTLENFYGVTSEFCHFRMESLCSQLRASFGAHALDLILSCFGTPNLQTDHVPDVQAIHKRFHSI